AVEATRQASAGLADEHSSAAEAVEGLLVGGGVQGVGGEPEQGGPQQHLTPLGQVRPLLDEAGPSNIGHDGVHDHQRGGPLRGPVVRPEIQHGGHSVPGKPHAAEETAVHDLARQAGFPRCPGQDLEPPAAVGLIEFGFFLAPGDPVGLRQQVLALVDEIRARQVDQRLVELDRNKHDVVDRRTLPWHLVALVRRQPISHPATPDAPSVPGPAPLPACRPAAPPVNRAVAAAPPRSTIGVVPAPDPVGAATPATRPPPGAIRWPARGPTPGRPPGRLREVSSARLPPGPTGATTGPPGRGPPGPPPLWPPPGPAVTGLATPVVGPDAVGPCTGLGAGPGVGTPPPPRLGPGP